MARSRTAERKKEREKQQRRQRLRLIAVLVGAVAVLVIAVIVIATLPAEAPIPEVTATRYDGVQRGRTDDGFPRLGEPNARLQVAEYARYDCPDCAAFHEAAIDDLVERARDGLINVTFYPLASTTGNSRGAARAALCAAEQDRFWQVTDALYEWLGLYGEIQAFTNNRIQSGISALNLNVSQYNNCLGRNEPNDLLNEAATRFQNLTGGDGITPIFTINGVVPTGENGGIIRTAGPLIDLIDQTIADQEPLPTPEVTAEATTETTPEATAAATAEAAATEPATAEPAATAEATPDE